MNRCWIIVAALLSIAVQAQEPPSPAEVMAVPEALEQLLQERVTGRSLNEDQRLDALVDLMFSSSGLNFKYIAEPTRDVAGTFEHRNGNCLAFTLLFMALAERAGLRAVPREVQVPLSWRREGSALFEAGHINLLVTTPTRRAVVDFEPDAFLARRLATLHRGQPVSKDRALAHFYNNRAAELMAQGHMALAERWSEQALALAPDFHPALNNRGVIAVRSGQFDAAEAFYQRALAAAPENVSTLLNLVNLHLRQDQPAAAERYFLRLESLRPRDPYFLWALGQQYQADGELTRARRLFRDALRLSPNEAIFHASLASVAEALGENELAVDALGSAIRLAPGGDPLRDEYLDRLRALKSQVSVSVD